MLGQLCIRIFYSSIGRKVRIFYSNIFYPFPCFCIVASGKYSNILFECIQLYSNNKFDYFLLRYRRKKKGTYALRCLSSLVSTLLHSKDTVCIFFLFYSVMLPAWKLCMGIEMHKREEPFSFCLHATEAFLLRVTVKVI